MRLEAVGRSSKTPTVWPELLTAVQQEPEMMKAFCRQKRHTRVEVNKSIWGTQGSHKNKRMLTLYGWCFCFGCFGDECQQHIFACSSSCFLILSNLIQDLYTSSYVYDVVRKLRSPSAWLLKNHLENTRQEGF